MGHSTVYSQRCFSKALFFMDHPVASTHMYDNSNSTNKPEGTRATPATEESDFAYSLVMEDAKRGLGDYRRFEPLE